MSVATELRSVLKPSSETREVLGKMKVSEEKRSKNEALKKPKKVVCGTPKGVSVESRCSSWGSSVKNVGCEKRRVKSNGVKSGRIVPEEEIEALRVSPVVVVGQIKRCDWITPNSDPLYTCFHDEEWGVPVHDDRKLFELLVLSQALAELTWPAILYKRDMFRKLFDNFDPSSISKFTEKRLLLQGSNCSTLLSEQKFRAIVENANQLLKVQQEFGSFSNYCWRFFVNHKPMRNGFRYARQVPAKTPKSELMSKDLMQRGFRCVGPTVVYSFMQVAGMVNDHLVACFRYNECNSDAKNDFKIKFGVTEVPTKAIESSH